MEWFSEAQIESVYRGYIVSRRAVGLKVYCRRFRLVVREHFFMGRVVKAQPMEVVKSPSLDGFQSHVAVVPRNMAW